MNDITNTHKIGVDYKHNMEAYNNEKPGKVLFYYNMCMRFRPYLYKYLLNVRKLSYLPYTFFFGWTINFTRYLLHYNNLFIYLCVLFSMLLYLKLSHECYHHNMAVYVDDRFPIKVIHL